GAGPPPLGSQGGPRCALRERPRTAARPSGTLADRPDPGAGARGSGSLPPRAPPLVREPPPRGRSGPPIRPGSTRARRHRHDRDLPPSPDRRGAPPVSRVPPTSVTVGPRNGSGGRGTG